MKQVLFLLFFTLFSFHPLFISATERDGNSQSDSDYETYAYRHVSTISTNGAKIQGTGKINYITFINKKSICYISDQHGNDIEYNSNYQISTGQAFYTKTNNNNIHIYETFIKRAIMNQYNISGMVKSFVNGAILGANLRGDGPAMEFLFKNDFSRLNIRHEKNGITTETSVWERINTSQNSQNDEFY